MSKKCWKNLAGVFAAVLVFAFWPAMAGAEEQPVLEFSGSGSSQDPIQFTRSDLEMIGLAAVVTTTPWHDGAVRFEGVSLKGLLEHAGASGTEVVVSALNDYSATIPMKDLAEFDPILALKLNGKYMEIEDKGPLFVIYPYDSDKRLQSEIYYSRSVWQASKIVVK